MKGWVAEPDLAGGETAAIEAGCETGLRGEDVRLCLGGRGAWVSMGYSVVVVGVVVEMDTTVGEQKGKRG